MKTNKRLMVALGTFMVGGFIYCVIELLYRGYTDVSMYILAGFCAVIMGGLNDMFSFDMQFPLQVFIASLGCISGEYIAGLLVNQDFTVWDYRGLPGTFADGQLNLLFCLAWVMLSFVGIPLLDYIEWKFMNVEPKPYYVVGRKIIKLY